MPTNINNAHINNESSVWDRHHTIGFNSMELIPYHHHQQLIIQHHASTHTTTHIINTYYSSRRNITNPCSNKGSIVKHTKKPLLIQWCTYKYYVSVWHRDHGTSLSCLSHSKLPYSLSYHPPSSYLDSTQKHVRIPLSENSDELSKNSGRESLVESFSDPVSMNEEGKDTALGFCP